MAILKKRLFPFLVWVIVLSVAVLPINAVSSFADVPSDSWYAEPVAWAVEQGITAGTSATTFSPNATCSKAQILTFLWRACGSPEPQMFNPFPDVSESDYFCKPAIWAYENSMVQDGNFEPNTPCSRSMAVTYLWKQAGWPNSSTATSFTDVSSDADYAQAVSWALSMGVTSGTSATTFSPDSICTRAQIATFLYRGLADQPAADPDSDVLTIIW